jgi:hypothetical protein
MFLSATLPPRYSVQSGAEKLFTTWEDVYACPVWQRFLEEHGFRRVAADLFEKALNRG